MLYHTGGCANQYCCAYAIYLLSCIALESCIVIYISVGAPVRGKYYVDVINDRYKQTHKLLMAKPLNPELI